MKALAVTRLSHVFGRRQALQEVSLCVEAGSFTVLLGPNGAGKTTLISLITGLYAPQFGEIRIFRHDARREPLAALAELGVVFQAQTLDLDLSVMENLRYHAALRGLSRKDADTRIRIELDHLQLTDRSSDKVRTLSGGMRRRVEIARALIHEPRLLIVDEATAGLDVAARRLLLAYVRELCRSRQLGVLWATHLLDEIEPDDPLVLLHAGKIRWQGQAAAMTREEEDLSKAFLRLTEHSS
ncbi:ABC transporter ATP-binding protein [Microvirga rosea]|uniref:ABC transporter ATP-binding protein n=1 Tax=Microvirga rosea TaxID=2715425 RepID=UPI001D0A2B3B|nr:ABC transporter ATP-binding protein [Microvirga rosea]MCB8821787.1 ATP-binding cassette domain-containing protein [Microvirga rosea]